MAAEEGLGVQRDLNVGGVRDWIADQNQVGHRWLLLPVGALFVRAVINAHETCAVKHLQEDNSCVMIMGCTFVFCVTTTYFFYFQSFDIICK